MDSPDTALRDLREAASRSPRRHDSWPLRIARQHRSRVDACWQGHRFLSRVQASDV